MPIVRYKPTTPGRRGASVLKHDAIGDQRVVKSLKGPLKSQAGRNNTGRITVRHRGSGPKRNYRKVDFVNPIEDKSAKIIGIQYDPNRTAAIALLEYEDGKKAYTLAVKGMALDDVIVTSREKALDIKPGNSMCIKHIPAGILVSNLELEPGRTSKVVRSAGSSAVVLSQEEGFVSVKMPSSEIRKFRGDCLATVGQVGNEEWSLVRLGKAGRMRNRGIRPTVRGKVMNPVDHPHGGGEGSNPIGLKHPKTPWGKPALGVPTRKSHKASDTLIVRRRKKKK